MKSLFAILLVIGSIPAWAQSDVAVNAAKEAGAVTTDSGLVYVPLRDGAGASPAEPIR